MPQMPVKDFLGYVIKEWEYFPVFNEGGRYWQAVNCRAGAGLPLLLTRNPTKRLKNRLQITPCFRFYRHRDYAACADGKGAPRHQENTLSYEINQVAYGDSFMCSAGLHGRQWHWECIPMRVMNTCATRLLELFACTQGHGHRVPTCLLSYLTSPANGRLSL